MRRMLARLLLGMVLTTGLGRPAGAQPVTDLDARVWPSAEITFAQLGSAVFPGATRDQGSGALVTGPEKVLRQPGTKERVTLPEASRIDAVKAFAVRGDGRRYLVTLWTVAASTGYPGDASTIVAIFPEGAREPPDPTDVVSVQTDSFCDTWDGKRLEIGPDDAFFIRNQHNNSNQSYLDTGLFHVVTGRLRRIAQIFTLDVRMDCAHTFFETLSWRLEPQAGGPYPDIVATVKVSPRTDCKGGKTAVRPRTYAETYRWNAAEKRFAPMGKGFGGLDAFNAESL